MGEICCVCQSVNGWVPAHIRPRPRALGGGDHLGERAGQVGLRLRDRRADAGDDLDRRLQQLVLGLGVLLGALGAELLEDLDGAGGELAGLAVDELQLPLHAQAGALGGLERDLHVGSLGSITGAHPPAEHDHPAGGPADRVSAGRCRWAARAGPGGTRRHSAGVRSRPTIAHAACEPGLRVGCRPLGARVVRTHVPGDDRVVRGHRDEPPAGRRPPRRPTTSPVCPRSAPRPYQRPLEGSTSQRKTLVRRRRRSPPSARPARRRRPGPAAAWTLISWTVRPGAVDEGDQAVVPQLGGSAAGRPGSRGSPRARVGPGSGSAARRRAGRASPVGVPVSSHTTKDPASSAKSARTPRPAPETTPPIPVSRARPVGDVDVDQLPARGVVGTGVGRLGHEEQQPAAVGG